LYNLDYNDTKDVDSLNFPGSLFTVEGKPAMLDNIVLEATFVNFNGLSNLCGKSDNETIQTYQATRFYAHTNT